MQSYLIAGVINNLFRRVYFPGMVDQLHTQTPELGLLAKTGRSAWSGDSVRIGARTTRNRSYRPTSSARERAALPATGRQGYGTHVIPCVIIHGSGGITAFASAASQGEGAFVQGLKAEIQGHAVDMQKDLGWDFFRTPLNILARINADPAPDAETLTLEQDPVNQAVHWRGEGNRAFTVNQLVEIFSATGVTRRASTAGNTTFIITDDNPGPNRTQISLTGFTAGAGVAGDGVEAGVTTGDLIVRVGSFLAQADPGDNTEAAFAFNGLEQILADPAVDLPARADSLNYELDVFQGIDRALAANRWSIPVVRNMAGALLDRNTFNQWIKLIQHRSGQPLDVILCEDAVQLALVDLMVGDQRYEPQKFPGGFQPKSLLWNSGSVDVPIVPSQNCPYDRAFGLSLDGFEFFMLQDMELIGTDGSTLRQDADDSDSWNYSFRMFGNMGSRKPVCGGKLIGIGGADEAYGGGANFKPYGF